MGSVVVVAIPKENDPVWKYSSEKIPHLTLLYLGNDDSKVDLQPIVEFVEHASNSLYRFSLEVDRRGKLGDEDADVLFFEKDKYFFDSIKGFRSYLLQNESISKAFNATEQFPSWTPHLTMGYPVTPAKTPDDDKGSFYYVNFDRIAIWIEDFEGPEFWLEDCYSDVAMSDNPVENFLAHFGVKGQKWGVRRTDAQLEASADAQIAALLKKKVRSGGVNVLSNDELGVLNKRINLEQKYKEWENKNPTLKQKATRYISKQIGDLSKTLVKDAFGSQNKKQNDYIKDFFKKNKSKKPKTIKPKPNRDKASNSNRPKTRTEYPFNPNGNKSPEVFNITNAK